MINKTILAASLAALSVAACNPGNGGSADQQNQAVNAVQDQTASVVGAAAAPVGAITDGGFVTNAAIGGLYEVLAGEIAAERSADPKIKALGRQMVADHGKANEELKPIAVAQNLAAPTTLDERHQGLIDNLRGATAADFDRVYLQQQVAAHNETATLLGAYGRMDGNAALKAWAAKTLPVIQMHQHMLGELDRSSAAASH